MSVIVWAADGSESSEKALPWAVEEARARGAKLIALHVEEVQPTLSGSAPATNFDEGDRRSGVEKLVKETNEAGVESELQLARLITGGTAHAIADAAKEHDAALIVVGTRGLGPLKGLVIGSVTQRLLHVSPCPVLVVPAEAA